jgi:polyhydroxybutyrate depolymerase
LLSFANKKQMKFLLVFGIVLLVNIGNTQTATINYNSGRTDVNFDFEGFPSNYVIHIPANIDTSSPVPLVYMFHGSGGNGERFWKISQWKEKAEAENFVAVFPSSYHYIAAIDGDTARVTKFVIDRLRTAIIDPNNLRDDLGFVREIYQQISAQIPIDENRVYACGFSNGSAFAFAELNIKMGDLFAATAGCGSVITSTLEPSNDLIPHYAIFGNLDNKAMTHPPFPYPIRAPNILRHPFFSEVLSNTINSLSLDSTYTVQYSPNQWTELAFETPNSMNNYENKFYFRMIRKLAHKFPNGRNHPMKAVDFI